jgi:hypothetical protein
MALTIRKIDTSVAFAAAAALNLQRKAIVDALTSYPHYDATATTSGHFTLPVASALQVTAADASSLATLRTLARDIWFVATTHFADAIASSGANGGAHAAADDTATTSFGSQTAEDASLSALQTALNAYKAALNVHASQSGVHSHDDSALSISTTDASDQSTANALANAIKSALNTHISAALAGPSIKIVAA